MILSKTCIKIISQRIPVTSIGHLLTVPCRHHLSVQRCTITKWRVFIYTALSLSVLILHIEGFAHYTPSKCTIIANSESIFLCSFFRRYENHPITGTRTIKSRSIRSFQNRNRLYIIGINIDRCSSSVDSPVKRSTRSIVISKRNTIDNP